MLLDTIMSESPSEERKPRYAGGPHGLGTSDLYFNNIVSNVHKKKVTPRPTPILC